MVSPRLRFRRGKDNQLLVVVHCTISRFGVASRWKNSCSTCAAEPPPSFFTGDISSNKIESFSTKIYGEDTAAKYIDFYGRKKFSSDWWFRKIVCLACIRFMYKPRAQTPMGYFKGEGMFLPELSIISAICHWSEVRRQGGGTLYAWLKRGLKLKPGAWGLSWGFRLELRL